MRHLLGSVALILCVTSSASADVADAAKKLKSAEATERRQAAQELSEAGAAAKPALDALIKALETAGEDRFVRTYAARALGNIGPDAKKAIPALTAALTAEHANVRTAAVKSLTKMGPDAIPALGQTVMKGSSDLHETAVTALAGMGKPAYAQLMEIVKGAKVDASYRRMALAGVMKLGADAKPAKADLFEQTKGRGAGGQEGQQFRIDLLRALGELATKSDADIVKMLDGIASDMKANGGLRKAAQQALDKIKSR